MTNENKRNEVDPILEAQRSVESDSKVSQLKAYLTENKADFQKLKSASVPLLAKKFDVSPATIRTQFYQWKKQNEKSDSKIDTKTDVRVEAVAKKN
jgi:hypothetical protein